MFDTLGNLESVIKYFDDILLFGKIRSELHLSSESVLVRIFKSDLKLN